MPNPLIRKLEIFAALSRVDRKAIELLSAATRTHRPGEDLIVEGERPDCVYLLMKGWACRYKTLPDGQRQILGYILPGDTSDVFSFVVDTMCHSVAALGACTVVAIPHAELADVLARHPKIARAFYWAGFVDGSISREWLVSIGQRDGLGRAAHLFSELLLRMGSVGLAGGDSFLLPLTQTDLADTIGMTPVYVNRTLQRMRGEGLITLEKRALTIHDLERLIEIGSFTPGYLHLKHQGQSSLAR